MRKFFIDENACQETIYSNSAFIAGVLNFQHLFLDSLARWVAVSQIEY